MPERAKKSQRNPLAQSYPHPQPSQNLTKRPCTFCHRLLDPRGVANHERTCLNRDGFESRGHSFLAQRRREKTAEKAAQNSRSNPPIFEDDPWERLSKPRTRRHCEDEMQPPSSQIHEIPPPASPAVSDDVPIDVHVEYHRYHPSANRAPSDFRLEDFGQPAPQNIPSPSSDAMYSPFNTKSEFLFAKLAMDASLTHDHIQTFCDIINHCITGQDSFGIKTAKEFEDRLNNSSSSKYTHKIDSLNHIRYQDPSSVCHWEEYKS